MLIIHKAMIVTVVLLVGAPLYPCSIVIIGGWQPMVVQTVSGNVIGWDRKSFGVFEGDRIKLPSVVPIEDALLVVTIRTDVKFFQESDMHPNLRNAAGMDPKQFLGQVTEYKCGALVASTKANAAGAFTFANLKPGKYCVDVGRPKTAEDLVLRPFTFLVDVIESAPKGTLLANIRERMPDCSGGESLKLVTAK